MTYFSQVAAATSKMEAAKRNGGTWVIAKPGCAPLYEAPTFEAARAMLTTALRKQGYQVFKGPTNGA